MTDTATFMKAFWQEAKLTKPAQPATKPLDPDLLGDWDDRFSEAHPARPGLDLMECKRYCLAYECSADVIESVAFDETVKHFKLTVAEAEVLARLLTQPEPILNLPEGEEF